MIKYDALSIGLILDNIFYYLTKNDLFVCTSVCRFWFQSVPKKFLWRFQWDITNNIFASKEYHLINQTKTIPISSQSFCNTFGCQLNIKNDDSSSKLMLTSNDKFAITVDLKRKFETEVFVRYIKLPSYFSKTGTTCHYAIVDDFLIVDFSDLEHPFLCDEIVDHYKSFNSPLNRTTFLDVLLRIYMMFSRNTILSLPKADQGLLLQNFPLFPEFDSSGINWMMSENDVIFGSSSSKNKALFAIFDKLKVKLTKVISLDAIDLSFENHNQTRIFCNRYLMVLANSGICVFDCFSNNDQPLLVIKQTLPFYFAANVTLTNKHFICMLGNMDHKRFYYYIFDMEKLIYKRIDNYFDNFFNNFRIEQVSDDILYLHNFYQGRFKIDLSVLTLTSLDQKTKTLFKHPLIFDTMTNYDGKYAKIAFPSCFESSLNNCLSDIRKTLNYE